MRSGQLGASFSSAEVAVTTRDQFLLKKKLFALKKWLGSTSTAGALAG
jgi:hypothetical protein